MNSEALTFRFWRSKQVMIHGAETKSNDNRRAIRLRQEEEEKIVATSKSAIRAQKKDLIANHVQVRE